MGSWSPIGKPTARRCPVSCGPNRIPLRPFSSGQKVRIAMNMRAGSRNRGHAVVTAVVFASFLWALALSVSPYLHSQIHSDSNQVEHSCAATFVATGNYEHTVHPPLVSAPLPIVP